MQEPSESSHLAGEGDDQLSALLEAQKRSKRRAMLGGLGIVAALGALVFVATQTGGDKEEVKEPDPRQEIEERFGTTLGADWFEVIDMAKTYDAEPCKSRSTLKLIDTLINHKGYKATIEIVDHYLKECGPSRNIQWKRLHSNKMLERYEDAIVDGNDLVRQRPTDSDFWWWRGELHHKAGHYEQAIYDYWQSYTNRSNSAATKRLSWMPDDTGKYHCTSAFLLRMYIQDENPSHHSWDTTFREAYVGGACDAQTGQGKGKIKMPSGEPMPKTVVGLRARAEREATVVEEELLVDPKTPYTIVTKELAEAAGLSFVKNDKGAALEIEVRAAGDFHTAKLAVVESMSVGKATAAKVRVAVVDSLPGELKGVLGANFLYRFRGDYDGKVVSLSAW